MTLTYQMYLADPDLRRRLECDARRMQANAMRDLIAAPAAGWLGRMLRLVLAKLSGALPQAA